LKRRVPPIESVLRGLTVAIDGPSAAGKTTTARGLARRLGLRHVDTGAMYRAVTLAALRAGADFSDGEALGALADACAITFDAPGERVRLGDEDVTEAIREAAVTAAVSAVSAHPRVRTELVRRQRALARGGGVVLEGRDIGSVVLPWADVKIFLVAAVRTRAERRQRELGSGPGVPGVEEVARDLERRDALDASREASPLLEPVGAWRVDTGGVTIAEQIEAVADIARRTARRLRALHEPRMDGARPRRQRLVMRAVTALIRLVARVLFGLRVHDRFRGELEENYIFACNHLAYSDPPFAGSTLPRECHFIAKASLFDKPIFGGVIRYFNAFPIKRGVFDREAMAEAASLLRRGASLMIFPEGGRMRGGRLGEARGGVGYLALTTGVPVVPVYVSGTDRLHECLFRRARLEVVHGRAMRIPPEALERLGGEDDREAYRRFGDEVMNAVAALQSDARSTR
jgi:cytidylate kinase